MEYIELIIVGCIFSIYLLLNAIKAVPIGMEYTVEALGTYKRTLNAGLHFIIPFYEKIGSKISILEKQIIIPRQELLTNDHVSVKIEGMVFYQVTDTVKAAYSVRDIRLAILNTAIESIRSYIKSKPMNTLTTNAYNVEKDLQEVIDDSVKPWGAKIVRLEIRNLTAIENQRT
jgi:regulator of protease activity HflC (stomatin/prohibitin superfamily)